MKLSGLIVIRRRQGLNEKVSSAFLFSKVAGMIGDHYDSEVQRFIDFYKLTPDHYFLFTVGMSKDYSTIPLIPEIDKVLKEAGYDDGYLYVFTIDDM